MKILTKRNGLAALITTTLFASAGAYAYGPYGAGHGPYGGYGKHRFYQPPYFHPPYFRPGPVPYMRQAPAYGPRVYRQPAPAAGSKAYEQQAPAYEPKAYQSQTPAYGYNYPMSQGQAAAESADTGDSKDVAISGMRFQPASVTVKTGETVTWSHKDGAPHVVKARQGEFDSGTLRSGQSFSHTFDEAGTYEYYCSLHPSMRGTVVVL